MKLQDSMATKVQMQKVQSSKKGKSSYFKLLLLLTIGVFSGVFQVRGQTAYTMSSGNKTWDFADIVNWTNNFASGTDAANWGSVAANATGTIPDGVRTSVSSATFTTTTSGGVQKGVTNMYFLSTGSTSNGNSVAVDLYLDFKTLIEENSFQVFFFIQLSSCWNPNHHHQNTWFKNTYNK
jgi:hypothetical protein